MRTQRPQHTTEPVQNTSWRLKIKAVPGAARDEICGWLGDSLKIRVTAPPQAGQANQAIIRLLAHHLGIPASNIRIIQGAYSPQKTAEITGSSPQKLNHPAA